jgi:four helix bundle protein
LGDFKQLRAWKEAEDLVEMTYEATRKFPHEERYGLVTQMRRAACSVCANIAEGCGRLGDRELARFVRIAAGSATELESLIMLSQRLNLLPIGAATELLGKSRRVQKRLYRLNQFLGRRLASKTHDP